MGDTINVAARVETVTRDTGDTLLISGSTRELLSTEPVDFVEREGVELKCKASAVRLFAPASASGDRPGLPDGIEFTVCRPIASWR